MYLNDSCVITCCCAFSAWIYKLTVKSDRYLLNLSPQTHRVSARKQCLINPHGKTAAKTVFKCVLLWDKVRRCHSDLLTAFNDATTEMSTGLWVNHGGNMLFGLQVNEKFLVALCLLPAIKTSTVTLRKGHFWYEVRSWSQWHTSQTHSKVL